MYSEIGILQYLYNTRKKKIYKTLLVATAIDRVRNKRYNISHQHVEPFSTHSSLRCKPKIPRMQSTAHQWCENMSVAGTKTSENST